MSRASQWNFDYVHNFFQTATQIHSGDIAYFPSAEELSREGEGDDSERARRAATSFKSRLWPGGIVHYTFSTQFSSKYVYPI